jgi:hypothetical protein
MAGRTALAAAALVLLTSTLTGCWDDSKPSAVPPGGAGNVPAPPPLNQAPTIAGVAPSTAKVGEPYVFVPQANDPENEPLTYAIARKPSWMSFSTSTGQLFGVPGQAAIGVHKDIEISVTDGKAIASLPRFSIQVATASGTGSAKLRWVAPTQTTSGTPLKGLAGFRVYYGPRQPQFDFVLDVQDDAATQVTIDGLGKGTWYFAISAYTENGIESARSNVAMKSI